MILEHHAPADIFKLLNKQLEQSSLKEIKPDAKQFLIRKMRGLPDAKHSSEQYHTWLNFLIEQNIPLEPCILKHAIWQKDQVSLKKLLDLLYQSKTGISDHISDDNLKDLLLYAVNEQNVDALDILLHSHRAAILTPTELPKEFMALLLDSRVDGSWADTIIQAIFIAFGRNDMPCIQRLLQESEILNFGSINPKTNNPLVMDLFLISGLPYTIRLDILTKSLKQNFDITTRNSIGQTLYFLQSSNLSHDSAYWRGQLDAGRHVTLGSILQHTLGLDKAEASSVFAAGYYSGKRTAQYLSRFTRLGVRPIRNLMFNRTSDVNFGWIIGESIDKLSRWKATSPEKYQADIKLRLDSLKQNTSETKAHVLTPTIADLMLKLTKDHISWKTLVPVKSRGRTIHISLFDYIKQMSSKDPEKYTRICNASNLKELKDALGQHRSTRHRWADYFVEGQTIGSQLIRNPRILNNRMPPSASQTPQTFRRSNG